MRLTFNHLLLLFIILLFQACSAKVRTIYDLNYDYDQLSTFCWQEHCELTFKGPDYIDDSILIHNISEIITNELTKKGFKKVAHDHNFLVDVHIVLEEKQRAHPMPVDHEFENGEWITSNQQNISPGDEQYRYIEGTFVLDIIDFKSGTLIWRSAVIGAFEHKPHIDDEYLRKIVKKALEYFPPST